MSTGFNFQAIEFQFRDRYTLKPMQQLTKHIQQSNNLRTYISINSEMLKQPNEPSSQFWLNKQQSCQRQLLGILQSVPEFWVRKYDFVGQISLR